MKKRALLGLAALIFIVPATLPTQAHACACGCGVFDVGTGNMMPTDAGGSVWLEYNYLNQSQNRSGTSRADKANNDDKQVRTDFITLGGQYMFNRSWGIQAAVPYVNRQFRTTDEDTGDAVKFTHGDFGDVRLKAVYSGLSDDMSTGITFGLKLPTGSYHHDGFDRDTDIGTGSTDLLLGAYHMGDVPMTNLFKWFVNGQWQQAIAIQNNYRPGDELDAGTGLYFTGVPEVGGGKLTPIVQLLGTHRYSDRGENAMPDNTGYSRLMVGPGLEYTVRDVKLYGDVELPIYQNVNGNQLTSPVIFKLLVGYNF